jgi:hypothetical protein
VFEFEDDLYYNYKFELQQRKKRLERLYRKDPFLKDGLESSSSSSFSSPFNNPLTFDKHKISIRCFSSSSCKSGFS